MKHSLPKLKYSYKALEPYIDEKTMMIHHSKHHQGYVDKLNLVLEKYGQRQAMSLKKLLEDLSKLPEAIRVGVRDNGGGHYNHSLFWRVMGPDGGGQPKGKLMEAIKRDLGGFEEFKKRFKEVTLGQFGSGWIWLSVNNDGELMVEATANQDSPIMEGRLPLLNLDVWEHAYYLKYQNRRADYAEAWWQVVNWREVERIYEERLS